MKIKIKILFVLFFTVLRIGFAQETLHLSDCYTLLDNNYPLLKQAAYYDQQNDLDLAIIKNKKKPSFEFDAQGNYLSDVTHLPIQLPNVSIAKPNLLQYKAYAQVNQLIYDGGLIKATLNAQKDVTLAKKKALEVSVYQMRLQINQLYYSVLSLQEQKAILIAKSAVLNAKLKEVKAGVKYGVLLPSQDAIIEASMLKLEQQIKTVTAQIASLKNTLATLIGKDISNASFENEPLIIPLEKTIKRPELALFQLKKDEITNKSKIFNHKNSPKLLGFAQGGLGNPALNMLDNSLQSYYIVGLKFKWNFFDWNTTKKEKEKVLINKSFIDNQQEVFELQTKIALDKQLADIENLKNLLTEDKHIITLREKIVKTVASQLKNGVVTSSVYIQELSNLTEAKTQAKTHQIQLELAKANYNTLLGNQL